MKERQKTVKIYKKRFSADPETNIFNGGKS